jgi:hypothetical protein
VSSQFCGRIRITTGAALVAVMLTAGCASAPATPSTPRQTPAGGATVPTAPATSRATGIAAAEPTQGISPEAVAQIDALLRDKAQRTPVQQRIDSQLLYAQQAAAGRAVIPGLAVDVTTAADGRQLLDVRANVSDALIAQVRGLGADVLESDVFHRALRVQARLDQIETIAGLPGVLFVSPAQLAHTVSITPRSLRPPHREERIALVRRNLELALQSANAGSKTSQGDVTHRAATARSTFNIDGTGVKIGVLSDGVTNLAASQALGDLGAVTVLAGQTGSGDEGTAMLEIIHDLAPGAQLYFATAFTSNTSFANNIRALRDAGCSIIVDDVYYFNESPFQDGQASSVVSPGNAGVITEAVKDVASTGVLYFSSAGNGGNLDDGTSGTWEGDFVDGGPVGSPITAIEAGQLHTFGSQPWNVLIAISGNSISLYWSDPLGGSSNDYDLFRLNSTGATIRSASTNTQAGSQDPYEQVTGASSTASAGDRLIIVKYSGSARFLHLDIHANGPGKLSIATSGETHGHAATTATNSFGVAATPALSPGPYPSAFSGSNVVETFSSDGPRRIFYTSSGTAITAGNVSASGGQVLNKPDLTAADRVSVTGVGGFPSTFSGTSAAAPHAGAIAALIKSANLGLTADQVRTALLNSAIDIEAIGLDRDSGVGIVMADTAVLSLAQPTIASVSPGSGSTAGGTTVTITGTKFVVGGTTVTIGGTAATTVNAGSTTTLSAVTPPGSAGAATVTATTINGAGSLAGGFTYFTSLFTDDPLQIGITAPKAVHVVELREYVNALNIRYGLPAIAWTDPVIASGTTPIRAVHLTELRSALNTIYVAAGRTPPTYSTSVTAGSIAITAAAIVEIRAAVTAIW